MAFRTFNGAKATAVTILAYVRETSDLWGHFMAEADAASEDGV